MMKRQKRLLAAVLILSLLLSASVSLKVFAYDQVTRGLDLSQLLESTGLAALLGGDQQSGSSGSSAASDSDSMADLGTLLGLLGVTQRKISECKISSISDKTYTGKEITPLPTITWNGTRLKKGTDYNITWSDNVKVGTAKCRITGKGDYTGSKTVSFKIVKKESSSSSSSKKETESSKKKPAKSGKFTVSLKTRTYIYNGKVRKPKLTVKAGQKTVPASSYTVSYKNNKNVGKAEVIVKGKGDYKNYKGEAYFYIELKKPSFKSVKAAGNNTIDCTWNTDAQCDGYQIEYCTNKTFKNTAKKITIKETSASSVQIEKLTAGKNYYLRIRSFKKVGTRNRYSEWSSVRQAAVKNK